MFCSYKYILEYNLPSVQSGCWYCQSNTSELNWGNNFLLTMWVRRQKSLPDIEKEFEENERRLMELSSELVALNCEMQVHLQVRRSNNSSTLGCPEQDLSVTLGITLNNKFTPYSLGDTKGSFRPWYFAA